MKILSPHLLGKRIGFRYLRAKKSSSFLSLITMISIGGITVGVMTLIVTLCVMAGFEMELKKRLFSAETHVLIQSKGQSIGKSEDLVSKIRSSSEKITHVFPVLQTEVILRAGKKVNGSLVKGIESEQLAWLEQKISEKPSEEHDSKPANMPRIFVGYEMALDLGIVPGDIVTAVSPIESDGPMGAIPRVKRFYVDGIYKTGVPEQELHVVFTEMKNVESFLGRSPGYSEIEVLVNELEESDAVAATLSSVLPEKEFSVRSWNVLNAHLFHSLRLERAAMFFILVIIIVVATFNIVSTLTMMVLEKKKSLSILRAMGATKNHIRLIFLWEGLAIGLIGIVAGLLGGVFICRLLASYPIIELPEYYYDRTLPVITSPSLIALVCVTALVIVLCGAIIPARKASELPLMQGFR